jgi:hypothetical protein
VFAAINYEEPQEVTWEHIGSLAVFASDLRHHGEACLELAAKLAHVATEDLEPIRCEGSHPNMPSFDKLGFSTDNPVVLRRYLDKIGFPYA